MHKIDREFILNFADFYSLLAYIRNGHLKRKKLKMAV